MPDTKEKALWLACQLRSWASAATDVAMNGYRAAAPASRAFVPLAIATSETSQIKSPGCLTTLFGTGLL